MLSDYRDHPKQEFIAALKAFDPQYAAVCCVKEMVELLLILNNAPVSVQNGIDGFLKGTYADRLFSHVIADMRQSDRVAESNDGQNG